MTDVVSNALGNLVSDGVSKGVKQLVTGNNPDDTQRINHAATMPKRTMLYNNNYGCLVL
jgi:hypothetical protein